MIGAIAGDIIGSTFEFNPTRTMDFPILAPGSTFTDDTVMTIAVADCLLHQKEYASTLRSYGLKYPHRGYGGMFQKWLNGSIKDPYNSYGNGSAMRVSPVGFAFTTLEEVLEEAEKSAAVTHNHPEGIKGAQSVAAAVFLARQGESKARIKAYIEGRFGYNLSRTIDEIRPYTHFDETCQVSVPEAIIAFLDSESFEDAVRKAVSLGADADTQACIAGGIAQAYYKQIPEDILKKTREILDPELLRIVDEFNARYSICLK